MTQPFEATVVLFVDMLGFADLVEKEGEQIAMRIIPLKPSDKMRLDVRSEVNYLDPKTDSHSGPDFDDCLQFDALRWMIGLTEELLQYRYIETFHAWNIMRVQLGRVPYPWEKFLDRDEYDYSHGIRTRPDAKES